MTVVSKAIGLVLRTYMQRSARKFSFDQLIDNLERHGDSLARRLDLQSESPKNIAQLRHLIGIERWGQMRLQTTQGTPLIQEEYDGYKPDKSAWPELVSAFRETRAQTVEIARQLQAKAIPLAQTALHNDAGDMTLAGWLRYLDVHAGAEAKRIK